MITMSEPVTLWLAFGAGLLSFVSPCVLPLYPSYISYISGVSWGEGADRAEARRRALKYAIFFVLGFSTVFLALGWSASLIGQLFVEYKMWLRIIGGIVVIFMGMVIAGWIRSDWLMQEKKWTVNRKPVGYFGAWLIGVSFAAGWTPCIGPILASVLVMAANEPGRALLFMALYALGFALPFLILAFSLTSWKWLQQKSGVVSKAGGVIMVVMGFLLLTDSLSTITVWLTKLFGGFTGF
ncbi:cytochrome C biogenesis protein [Kyrpidia spormannii]|uniref:Cytochrome C biogenesis protein n=3 Tax=Kyrpidia spormannii TaxID=2055160 RepID=A0A2K8NAN4_9BACL|nr:cytochrome C biogenesis protein [Kyrpidia spormannii]MCL6575091.1 cytochrome c biogenesis protein CcdA [Kyrpidia sp.]HHY66407.1 cytochrome c biogenesis protein CcdA [Alicyclobacillus sp.]